MYASVTTANPSPLNYDFADTTSNVTKIVYITRNVVDTQSKVYVAVQGSAITNTYKIVFYQGVFSSFSQVSGVSEAASVNSLAVAAPSLSTVPGYTPQYIFSLDGESSSFFIACLMYEYLVLSLSLFFFFCSL